jgi:hypothetical protein
MPSVERGITVPRPCTELRVFAWVRNRVHAASKQNADYEGERQ